jgi:uncharacterized protein YehS (DUF1456 family)
MRFLQREYIILKVNKTAERAIFYSHLINHRDGFNRMFDSKLDLFLNSVIATMQRNCFKRYYQQVRRTIRESQALVINKLRISFLFGVCASGHNGSADRC